MNYWHPAFEKPQIRAHHVGFGLTQPEQVLAYRDALQALGARIVETKGTEASPKVFLDLDVTNLLVEIYTGRQGIHTDFSVSSLDQLHMAWNGGPLNDIGIPGMLFSTVRGVDKFASIAFAERD